MLRRCVWSRNIKNKRSIYIYDISSLRVKVRFRLVCSCWCAFKFIIITNYNDKTLRWTNLKIDLWIWNIICRLGSYVPVWVFFAKKISIKLHEISQLSDSIARRLCTSHHCISSVSFLKSDYALRAYVSKPGKQNNRADWKSKHERQLVTVASVPKRNTITSTQNTDSRFRCDQKILKPLSHSCYFWVQCFGIDQPWK